MDEWRLHAARGGAVQYETHRERASTYQVSFFTAGAPASTAVATGEWQAPVSFDRRRGEKLGEMISYIQRRRGRAFCVVRFFGLGEKTL